MIDNCEKCVTDRSLCDNCRDNPKYADYPKYSKFQEYIPVCPIGERDCIYDPAYIKCHHPEWYKSLYGDKTPEESVEESCKKYLSEDDDYKESGWCSHYDDEDK